MNKMIDAVRDVMIYVSELMYFQYDFDDGGEDLYLLFFVSMLCASASAGYLFHAMNMH